jgi:cell division GTPase FtsZ
MFELLDGGTASCGTARIKVVGIGGGGGNALNTMIN